MLLNVICVIIGFFVLIKGADLFIDGVSSSAINLKIPKIIIALTIVAFGTSAPEFAISVQGMMDGNGDVVLANVIGSTIVNTMLVIGIASVVRPIKVKNETIKKELPLHLIIITIFAILFTDSIFKKGVQNEITRGDGIALFLAFLVFLYYIFSIIKNRGADRGIKKEKAKYKLRKSIIYSVIGLIAIFIGSDLAVDNAVSFATQIGVSHKFITMIVLVIGTSTPELVMAITSAKKGEFDIILGNIIGTNIFNIGFVLVIPVMIFGGVVAPGLWLFDMIMVVLSTLTLYVFAKGDKVISKKEGLVMLFIFLLYYGYVVFNF